MVRRAGIPCSAVAVAIVAALTLCIGPGGSVTRAHAAETPIEGTWRGAHLVRITGTLSGGFKVLAAESWTISRVCTISSGTVLETYTPLGGSRFAVRWLNVWVPMNPDAPGASCEFVFDGGPVTVTVTVGGSGKTITVDGCGSACSLAGAVLTRTGSPSGPSPKPRPKPNAGDGRLVLELAELPERYGRDENHDGLVDQFLTPQRINPAEWTAEILVRTADGGDCDHDASYAFTVDGRSAHLEATRVPCLFSYAHFRGLGAHRATVTATRSDGSVLRGAGTIELRDYLVVGIGDSVGSGEGNPDIGAWGFTPTWVDSRCHRSHSSYQAWAAGWLADTSRRTSVTFVHLACSGAQITSGLVAPYEGIEDPGTAKLPAQVKSLGNLLARSRRAPDAVLLSIGANDLGFGSIVAFCIEKSTCWDRRGFDRHHPERSLREVVAARVASLPARYRLLDAALRRAGVRASRVYISEYFDPTRDAKGKPCRPLIAIPFGAGEGTVTGAEAEWAYDEVIAPLNRAVARAAKAYGWNLVAGAAGRFRTHGYCARDTWVVQVTEALWRQGGVPELAKTKLPAAFWWIDAPAAHAGALHPNREGHKQIALLVTDALKRDAIDGQLER